MMDLKKHIVCLCTEKQKQGKVSCGWPCKEMNVILKYIYFHVIIYFQNTYLNFVDVTEYNFI